MDLSESFCTGNATEFACIELIKYIATKAECSCSLISDKLKKKKISFSDAVTVQVIPSDASGVFWIKENDLFKLYQQKSHIFKNKQSFEFQAFDMIASAIYKSHQIFGNIYRFLNRVDGYEVYLSQTKVKINEITTVDFPNSEILRILEGNKEYFKGLAVDLLNLLRPTYEINEHLLKVLKSMDETKIFNPNLFKAVSSAAEKMNFFDRDLMKKIQNCRLDDYIHYLKDIRTQTNRLELNEITLDDANGRLNSDLNELKKVEAGMNYYLKLALGIDFSKLHEATIKFFDLVNKALVTKQE